MRQNNIQAVPNNKQSCQSCLTRKYCLAKDLSAEDLQLSQSLMRRHRLLKKGERLFLQGDALQSLFIVRSGSVKTYYISDDGEQQVTGFHFPGQVLGVNGFENRVQTVSVEALETTSVCELNCDDFDRLCEKLPTFRHEFYRSIGRELAQDKRHMLVLGKLHADQRLADFILQIASLKKARGQVYGEFILSMARTDIANYLGVAGETVSRLLTRFQLDGLISIKRRVVTVVNLYKLQSLAGIIGEPVKLAQTA